MTAKADANGLTHYSNTTICEWVSVYLLGDEGKKKCYENWSKMAITVNNVHVWVSWNFNCGTNVTKCWRGAGEELRNTVKIVQRDTISEKNWLNRIEMNENNAQIMEPIKNLYLFNRQVFVEPNGWFCCVCFFFWGCDN